MADPKSSGEQYVMICPICKKLALVEICGRRFKSKCKCGAEFSGSLTELSAEEAEEALRRISTAVALKEGSDEN